MSARNEELKARFLRQFRRFENADSDVVIGDVVVMEDGGSRRTQIKATVSRGETLRQDMVYIFYGHWVDYTNPRSGVTTRQFASNSHSQATETDERSVVAYLSQIPGIGPATARAIWSRLGSDSIATLREHPQQVADLVPRVTNSLAEVASTTLKQSAKTEKTRAALAGLFEGRGLPRTATNWAIKVFGSAAERLIRKNPYLLQRMRGVGFKKADAMYLDLGHPRGRLKRQSLCLANLIDQQHGDTWHLLNPAIQRLGQEIGGTEIRPAKAVRLAVRGKLLSLVATAEQNSRPDWDGQWEWVASRKKCHAERELGELVGRAASEATRWPSTHLMGDSVSGHQLEMLNRSVSGPIGILGGSPGTGKTYTAAKWCEVLLSNFAPHDIGVAAPTGKAAVRLSEALAEYKLPLVARTWHSLLGVESSDDGWHFRHGRNNPFPYKVLIGDESSMLDVDLARSIFAARAAGCLMLLLGDINQLPPVGHGAPLRDMIDANLPYGELREIHRNDGGIVQACADIRDGNAFQPGGNLTHVMAHSGDEHVDAMLNQVAATAESHGVDMRWGVQVLCAVNEKSDLSRKKLNRHLQSVLNPMPNARDGIRLGDKVVNLKNGYFSAAQSNASRGKSDLPDSESVTVNARGDIYVANGELGEVVVSGPKSFTVALTSPRRVVNVPRSSHSWDLGYALSVHKSQGSEWPVVVVMLDDSGGAMRICTREWIYTAISRAKHECVLIGGLSVAHRAVQKTAVDKRKTFLRYHLIDQMDFYSRQQEQSDGQKESGQEKSSQEKACYQEVS
ncbi:MAG: AAA family ATPase [Pseudomonadota bacterium]